MCKIQTYVLIGYIVRNNLSTHIIFTYFKRKGEITPPWQMPGMSVLSQDEQATKKKLCQNFDLPEMHIHDISIGPIPYGRRTEPLTW